jgi:mRNA-degrading endonuclease toxin of MazEF toxin-antitoxin module
VDGALFAVDLMRSMPTERLLDRTGRASAEAMRAVRRAIVNIT